MEVDVGVGLDVGAATEGVDVDTLTRAILVAVGGVGTGDMVAWGEVAQAVKNTMNIETNPARLISPSP